MYFLDGVMLMGSSSSDTDRWTVLYLSSPPWQVIHHTEYNPSNNVGYASNGGNEIAGNEIASTLFLLI